MNDPLPNAETKTGHVLALATLAYVVTSFSAIVLTGYPKELGQDWRFWYIVLIWCFAPPTLLVYVAATAPRSSRCAKVGWSAVGIATAFLMIAVGYISEQTGDSIAIISPFLGLVLLFGWMSRAAIEPYHLPPLGIWRAAVFLSTVTTLMAGLTLLYVVVRVRLPILPPLDAAPSVADYLTTIGILVAGLLAAILAVFLSYYVGIGLGMVTRRLRGQSSTFARR